MNLFAPGYSILGSDHEIFIPNCSCYNSTANDEDECNTCQWYQTGTSQSTSIVLERCPNITNMEIKQMLRKTYPKVE